MQPNIVAKWVDILFPIASQRRHTNTHTHTYNIVAQNSHNARTWARKCRQQDLSWQTTPRIESHKRTRIEYVCCQMAQTCCTKQPEQTRTQTHERKHTQKTHTTHKVMLRTFKCEKFRQWNGNCMLSWESERELMRERRELWRERHCGKRMERRETLCNINCQCSILLLFY